jgi:hypothetical protein
MKIYPELTLRTRISNFLLRVHCVSKAQEITRVRHADLCDDSIAIALFQECSSSLANGDNSIAGADTSCEAAGG